jgi:3-oxoacyl-[acyl-carrier protein] reductase
MRMKDKVVLVTGGAAGIGKATALRFAEEGAKVVICDVNEAVGQETLKLLGEGASFYKVNVTSREDVQKWVDDVVAKYGRIDVIVSNAGVLRDGQLVKVKEGQFGRANV